MFSCSSASVKTSFSAPPFSKGLRPDQIIHREEAFEFLQPDLYHKSVLKGRRLYNTLTRSPTLPLVPVSAPVAQLTNWYSIARGTVGSRVDLPLEKELTERNIKMDGFEFVAVSSSQVPDAAYTNWYNVRQQDGCILNIANFKSHDINPQAQRLHPSEVVWQSWILAGDSLPSFDPSSLRIIARSAVLNLSVRRAIWYAARRSTRVVEDPATGYSVYNKEDEGFYAILGSDNGASSMRLLIDHKAELGNRTVEKIVVVGGPPSSSRNSAGLRVDLRDDYTRSRSFFLVLSERRVAEEETG